MMTWRRASRAVMLRRSLPLDWPYSVALSVSPDNRRDRRPVYSVDLGQFPLQGSIPEPADYLRLGLLRQLDVLLPLTVPAHSRFHRGHLIGGVVQRGGTVTSG